MNKKTSIIVIVLLFLVEILSIFSLFIFFKHKNTTGISLISKIPKSDWTTLFLQYPDLEIKDMKISDYSNIEEDLITNVDFNFAGKQYYKEYFGGLYNAYFYNNVEFSKPTLVVITGEAQTIYTHMLEFDIFTNTINEIKFMDKDKSISDSMCCNFMLLIPKKDGIKYDIGMPDFSYKIPKIIKYEYNQEKYTFVEKP